MKRVVLLFFVIMSVHLLQTPAYAQTRETGSTGLPVPRFVSLKSDEINVRVGPSRQHAIAWIFRKAGLPVEVTQEFETWRRIRDADGEEGWIFHSLLSGKRTAIIAPWETESLTDIYRSAAETSGVVAQAEPKVVVSLQSCEDDWCEIIADETRGFVRKNALWGVYPDEDL